MTTRSSGCHPASPAGEPNSTFVSSIADQGNGKVELADLAVGALDLDRNGAPFGVAAPLPVPRRRPRPGGRSIETNRSPSWRPAAAAALSGVTRRDLDVGIRDVAAGNADAGSALALRWIAARRDHRFDPLVAPEQNDAHRLVAELVGDVAQLLLVVDLAPAGLDDPVACLPARDRGGEFGTT